LPLHRRQHRASTPGGGPRLRRPEGHWRHGGPHLPRGTRACAPSPSARRCHPPDSFRPCRSSRLRRFALLDTLQVCCTLQPIMGFATFQAGRRRSARPPQRGLPKETRVEQAGRAMHGIAIPVALPPFGAFPSPTAALRHRSRCPLAVRRARFRAPTITSTVWARSVASPPTSRP